MSRALRNDFFSFITVYWGVGGGFYFFLWRGGGKKLSVAWSFLLRCSILSEGETSQLVIAGNLSGIDHNDYLTLAQGNLPPAIFLHFAIIVLLVQDILIVPLFDSPSRREVLRVLLWFEVWAGVHAEACSAAAEAVSLRAKLASVTGLAVQNVIVHVGVGGVQHLVAHTAFVTFLMEGDIAYHPGFGVVHRLAALGAFGVFGGLERHDCCDGWPSHGQTLEDG